MKSFGGTELIESAAGTVQKTHAGNDVLIDKCAHPNCVRSWAGQCNIECYQGQGTAPDLDHGCRTSPPGMVRAATLHAAAAQLLGNPNRLFHAPVFTETPLNHGLFDATIFHDRTLSSPSSRESSMA